MDRIQNILRDFFGSVSTFEMDKLLGGSTEALNVKVTLSGESYVVRILDPVLSLDERRKEAFVFQLAAKHQIAPAVYYISPDYSSMIVKYVEGATLQKTQIDQPNTTELIAQTLNTLHGLQADFLSKVDVLEAIKKKYFLCKQKLRDKDFPLLDKAMASIEQLEKTVGRSKRLAVSHGDLNPTNMFLVQGKVLLIDWGDAALLEPLYDVAIAGVLNAMSDRQMEGLLAMYLQKEPTRLQSKEFFFMTQVVRIEFALNLFSDLEISSLLNKEVSTRPLYTFLREEEALFGNKLRYPSEFLYDMAVSSLVEFFQKTS